MLLVSDSPDASTQSTNKVFSGSTTEVALLTTDEDPGLGRNAWIIIDNDVIEAHCYGSRKPGPIAPTHDIQWDPLKSHNQIVLTPEGIECRYK